MKFKKWDEEGGKGDWKPRSLNPKASTIFDICPHYSQNA